MKKSISHGQSPDLGPSPCETPEQLLRSPEFAQFLSLFNEVRHKYGCLGIVIPQEVAEDPILAKKVYDYYKTPEGSLAASDKGRRKYGALAKETVAQVRRSVGQAVGEKKETEAIPPEWLSRAYPEFKEKLPVEAIRDMEQTYQRELPQAKKIHGDAQLGMRMVSKVMNNFLTYVAQRDTNTLIASSRVPENKVVRDRDVGYSEKIKGMTWHEFYAEIDAVMEEKGLSADRVREMYKASESDSANFYLLPVFLELLRRGYKVYPDLSI